MSDLPPSPPSTPRPARPGVIVALVPIGAVLGFAGALVIETLIGVIAGAVFSAERPASFSWRFLSSLPGLGALSGAVIAPILYVRGRRST